jgi:hypothetical protein
MTLSNSVIIIKLPLYGNPTKIGWVSLRPLLCSLTFMILLNPMICINPSTPEEIESMVKEIPPDKAPGPDGFNGHFLKKMLAYY